MKLEATISLLLLLAGCSPEPRQVTALRRELREARDSIRSYQDSTEQWHYTARKEQKILRKFQAEQWEREKNGNRH